FLTSTTSAPSSSSRRRWASKSPCRARTPIFMLFVILTDCSVAGRAELRNRSQSRIRRLEADDRAECDSQVVVGAAIEIEFVAGLQAESNRAQSRLNTGGGIQGGVQV